MTEAFKIKPKFLGLVLGVALIARFLCAGLDIQATTPPPQDFLDASKAFLHLGYWLFLQSGQWLYGAFSLGSSPELVLTWAIAMQAVFGVGAALLGAELSLRLFHNQRLACCTGIGLAMLPNLLFMEHVIHPASLMLLSLLVLCRQVLAFQSKPNRLNSVLLVFSLLWLLMLVPRDSAVPFSIEQLLSAYRAFLFEGLPWDSENFFWGILVFFGAVGFGAGLVSEQAAFRSNALILGRILLGLLILSPLLSFGTALNRTPYEGLVFVFAAYGLYRLKVLVHTVKGEINGEGDSSDNDAQYH